MAASAVAHQTISWPQVYKRQPKIYCVVCGQYNKPSRQGKKLHKCVEKDCKNHIHTECNAGSSSFDCTLANLALLRKHEGSVKEMITFEPNNADLQYNQEFKNRIHAECNAGCSSFDCTLANLALLRTQEGSVKEKITFKPDNADLQCNTLDNKEYNEISECKRLKLPENSECDVLFDNSKDIINQNKIGKTIKQVCINDINNNKICAELHQHRKEHKRKSLLINVKTTGDEISSVESHVSNIIEKQDYNDTDIKSTQYRMEHKIKSLSDVENIIYSELFTWKNKSIKSNTTNYFDEEDFCDKTTKSYCDIVFKQLHCNQQYGCRSKFCEDTDIELSEADYEEPYTELLDQLYFEGHVADRNRKKYKRKMRKHRRKRKRICKNVNHFPVVFPEIEENDEYEALLNNGYIFGALLDNGYIFSDGHIFIGYCTHNGDDNDWEWRYIMYYELYHEYDCNVKEQTRTDGQSWWEPNWYYEAILGHIVNNNFLCGSSGKSYG